MDYFSYLCNIHQNIKIMRIKNYFKMNMKMKEEIVNPLSIKEALESSKKGKKMLFKSLEHSMPYLVGGSLLPVTPEERELEHKCNLHPNDRIVMVGDIQNPQSVKFLPYALYRLSILNKQGGHSM